VLEELEEEEQKNEGARGFFRRLFGRDKQENVRPDSIKIDVKSRRELRQERREMRREERKRRRNRD